MALIKCPKCGKEISDKSKNCINCGTHNKNLLKRTFIWLKNHMVAVTLITIILIVTIIISTIAIPKFIHLKNGRYVIMNGNSMYPTLNDGDKKFCKTNVQFKRYDVVTIKDENNNVLIKRIYGMPGENIKIENGNILVNGKKLDDKYEYGNTSDYTSIALNDDEYFVLGDNRDISMDSRHIGPIKKKNIRCVLQ